MNDIRKLDKKMSEMVNQQLSIKKSRQPSKRSLIGERITCLLDKILSIMEDLRSSRIYRQGLKILVERTSRTGRGKPYKEDVLRN